MESIVTPILTFGSSAIIRIQIKHAAVRLAYLVQCPPHANCKLNYNGDKKGVDEINNSRESTGKTIFIDVVQRELGTKRDSRSAGARRGPY